MGIFYNPPPTIISATGAQPDAPNKLPPQITAVPVGNPPPNSDFSANSAEVLDQWQKHAFDPQPFFGGKQPWQPRYLSPVIIAVPVNNPPFASEGRGLPNQWSAADPWAYSYLGGGLGRQPYGPETTIPTGTVVTYPLGFPNYLQYPSILASWQFQDQEPTLPRNLNPSITAVPVNNPQFVLYGDNSWLLSTVQAWQPPNPSPTLLRNLSPGIPGQSVDFPPFVSEELDQAQAQIVRAWQPADPQPQMPGKLSPGIPGQSVDNPPQLVRQPLPVQLDVPYPQVTVKQVQPFVASSVQQAFTSVWLNPVLVTWQPVDLPPTLPSKLNPFYTAVEVDTPPPFNPSAFSSLLTQWQPPDPPPTLPRNLSPGIPGQSVDNPPAHWYLSLLILPPDVTPQRTVYAPQAGIVTASQQPYAPAWLPTIVQSWQPLDFLPTLPKNLPAQLISVQVDNPPFGLLVTVVEPWVVDPLAQQPKNKLVTSVTPTVQVAYNLQWLPSVIASWQPPDPQPTLPRNLNPTVTGVTVNNPPFSHFGRSGLTIGEILAWQPPDPQPVQKGPLSPALTAVRVDNPPGINLANTETTWAVVGTWEIPLPPQPQQTRYIVHIIPPPVGKSFFSYISSSYIQ